MSYISYIDPVVFESDAGLETLEKKQRLEKAQLKESLTQYVQMYDRVNRNQICPCGSGLKYKKCCLGNVCITKEKLRTNKY